MIKFTFTKPPTFTLIAYLSGFLVISFTVTHQVLELSLINPVINQQIFIAGAIVVAIGSIFAWIYPHIKDRNKSNE